MSNEFDQSFSSGMEDLAKRNKAMRRRNLLIWLLAVLMCAFGIGCLFFAMDNARLAGAAAVYGQEQQQEKQGLAEEFDAACKSDDFKQSAAGSSICQKAEQVASEPSAPLAGPQGVQGVPGPRGEQGFPGKDGRDGKDGSPGAQGIAGLLGLTGGPGSPGKDSTVPGPMGPAGPAGKDSTVPGPAGASGKDSTVPGPMGPAGPAGADSTVPGPAGATGPQGEPGRGIKSAFCADDGRWSITYTDGGVQDGGVCRTTLPVGNGAP